MLDGAGKSLSVVHECGHDVTNRHTQWSFHMITGYVQIPTYKLNIWFNTVVEAFWKMPRKYRMELHCSIAYGCLPLPDLPLNSNSRPNPTIPHYFPSCRYADKSACWYLMFFPMIWLCWIILITFWHWKEVYMEWRLESIKGGRHPFPTITSKCPNAVPLTSTVCKNLTGKHSSFQTTFLSFSFSFFLRVPEHGLVYKYCFRVEEE